MLNPSELRYWRVLAVAVCAAVSTGVILEIRKHRWARVLNVGVPVGLGIILASSIVWLPMLARVQHWEHPNDAYEGSPYLLVFSLVPFLMACTMELAYRLVDIEPDSEVSSG